MKRLMFLLSLFYSVFANALSFEVISPCQFKYQVHQELNILLPTSVSKLTHYVLNGLNISYNGDESNIYSILNSPLGNDAFEVVGKNHYRSYGWCYEVDSISPTVTMDKFFVDPQKHTRITWFYGYAELFEGEWISYCEPLYLKKYKYICAK